MQGGPTENLPTSHDIGQAKLWGANLIRLALGEQKWPGLPQNSCHVDPAYPGKVDNAVNLITGMGLYVVLELHWVTIAACGPANAYPMADCNPGACNANAFWTALANRYKNNPLVGFDLFNEPHHISTAVWRNGGKTSWKGVNYTAAGMQPMYNSVRATGATNLVFVTGTSWGNTFAGALSGTNLVYSVHSYTCPGNPPPTCITPSPAAYDGSYFLKNWVTPGKTYPIFVAEWGWPQPGSSRYAQSLITFAEQHHWGWAEFTWGDNANSRFALIVNQSAGSTYEPWPGGMPALDTFPGG
jgi:aryl-phospho-beta-D-glucosidase BglC (GH1 family)